VCLVKRKVKSSTPGANFSPYLSDGACYEGYLGHPGEAKGKKEMISIIWIASDGLELVPTTDVKIILPYHTLPLIFKDNLVWL